MTSYIYGYGASFECVTIWLLHDGERSMTTTSERIAEVDRLMSEMDPEEIREVLTEVLRERYAAI